MSSKTPLNYSKFGQTSVPRLKHYLRPSCFLLLLSQVSIRFLTLSSILRRSFPKVSIFVSLQKRLRQFSSYWKLVNKSIIMTKSISRYVIFLLKMTALIKITQHLKDIHSSSQFSCFIETSCKKNLLKK